jgi:integrase
LLILLGARRDEVGGMTWSELLNDRVVWTLPPSRTKTGRGRELLLPRQAIDILATVPHVAGQQHLFGRNGFQAWSQSKARLDRRLTEMAARKEDAASLDAKSVGGGPTLPAWTLHDLRRSFITHVHELALAPPWIVDELVGHVGEHRRGARAHYNWATYREQKARALQAWADCLLDKIPAVVVPFRASA